MIPTTLDPAPPTARSRRGTPAGRAVVPALAAALLVAVLALLPASAGAQDIRLPGLSGGELQGSQLDQGTTIVVVWASWSPRCRDIVSRVRQLQERWGSRARVVTVSFQEDRAAVSDFLASSPMPVPVYLDRDGVFSKKYSVTTLPGLVVIQDGRTSYRGRLPDDPNRLLADVLGG